MLQWLYTYVVSFHSQCFIYFFRRMLQVHLSVYVAYVCRCFIWMLCMFLQWFQSRCFSSVSYAYFKCFVYLKTYVTNVTSECFKSKLGVTSPSSPSGASPQCLLFFLAPAGHPPPPPYLVDADDVQGDAGPTWDAKRCRKGKQARASGR
jgi:hypothetical protein